MIFRKKNHSYASNRKNKFLFFNEADDEKDENSGTTPDDNNNTNTTDNTTTDTKTDEGKDDDTNMDTGSDSDTGNLDSDTGEDENSDPDSDPEGGEEEGDETSGENDMPDDNGEDEESEDKIKQLQDDIFSSLTEDQIKIKVFEQKRRYDDMFSGINSILEKINNVQAPSTINKDLKSVSIKLDKFHDMITEYITKTYNTKSYIENEINFRKFLNILNGFDEILKDIIKNDIK